MILFSEANDRAFLNQSEWLMYWQFYAPIIQVAGVSMLPSVYLMPGGCQSGIPEPTKKRLDLTLDLDDLVPAECLSPPSHRVGPGLG